MKKILLALLVVFSFSTSALIAEGPPSSSYDHYRYFDALQLPTRQALPEVILFSDEYRLEDDAVIVHTLSGDAVADSFDMLWLDDKTLAIAPGWTTNQAAIQQISALMPSVTIIEVNIPDDIYIIGFIRRVGDKTFLVKSDLLPQAFLTYLKKQNYTLIEMPDEEWDAQYSFILWTAPEGCAVRDNCPDSLRSSLGDADITLFPTICPVPYYAEEDYDSFYE